MPTDDALDPFFAELTERAGTPKLGAEEAEELLRLARVVAHRVERRFAPLSTYLAGVLVGQSADVADPLARVERLRALRASVEEIAPTQRTDAS